MNRINSLGYNDANHSINLHRQCPLFVHTDAAQAIGKIIVDVEELQVDYLTIVGHKFYGPKIGALYARGCLSQKSSSNISGKNSKICPVIRMFQGASQENGLRPGTENVPMIVGLGKAADLVKRNLEYYEVHMRTMRDYLEKRLKVEKNEMIKNI
jgi:selenocysteine lyase